MKERERTNPKGRAGAKSLPWPNFLVIGAAKSGTTSLYNHLGQHPDVYMSPVKEPRFLAPPKERTYRQRVTEESSDVTDEAAYRALFDGATDEAAIGEASPGYLLKKGTAARIQRYVPGAKLIAILRHPVERAYSNYIALRGRGLEPIEDFEEALEAEERRIRRHWSPHWYYRRNGLYGRQLQRYFDRFDREQIFVCLHEDLRRDPAALMREIYAFLDVAPSFTPDTGKRHNPSGLPKSKLLHALTTGNPVASYVKPLLPNWAMRVAKKVTAMNREKPPLSKETKQRLTDRYYRQDLEHLQKLIRPDISQWLS